VHTPAGLLPIAVAGLSIREFLEGMREGVKEYSRAGLEENAAYRYALLRSRLLDEGKSVEILVNYHPKLLYLAEWFKQLFGESEGKEHKGIFPVSMINTTDLHSLGQYVQDGQRILFETVIDILRPKADIFIPSDSQDLDELNYLHGRDLHFINRKAMQATSLAHLEGGVPNILIEVEKLEERYLGKLMYFFMVSCAASGLLLGINPFNQPGVEAYKNNMFALLGKPGMEIETAEIEKKLNTQ
jgi:glucose-6-phosphate isomerase